MHHINVLTENHPKLSCAAPSLQAALALLTQCIKDGKKILLCGNGGSAADAEHICGELMKGFLLPRKLTSKERERFKSLGDDGLHLADGLQRAIPAISLVSGVSFPTAFANDMDPLNIFAQQVWGIGNKGDVLWLLSTSGNSENLFRVAQVARVKEMPILGMTGENGGRVKFLCDVLTTAPSLYTHEIQELHLSMYHALCASLEESCFYQWNISSLNSVAYIVGCVTN